MSTTLDHIVRHEFYDLRNMEAAEEFMKSKIAQLRSYLRIKDEINPCIVDYSEFDDEDSTDPAPIDYSFEIPNYDAHVQMARGFWIISQALSIHQLFTRYNREYDLRRDIFDIVRALGQDEAWHCSCYSASMGVIDYFEDDFETWLKYTQEHKNILEFDEAAIDAFRLAHPHEYYGEVIHDSFVDCRQNLEKLQNKYSDYHVCNLGRIVAKYHKIHNNEGCFLVNPDTGALLLDYPIDDILENICGAGMIIQKGGESAFYDVNGKQRSDYVDGKWEWTWGEPYSHSIIVYNEKNNLKFIID